MNTGRARQQTRRPLILLAPAVLALALSACTGPGAAPTDAGAPAQVAASAPLALSPDGRTLWVVNPDSDSLTSVDVSDPARPLVSGTIAVGGEPWAVAVAPNGTLVVMNRRSGSLSVLRPDPELRPAVRLVSETYVGAEPGGMVLSADGAHAFVTLSGDAQVALVEVATGRVVTRLATGPQPWALARSDERLIVAHRLARAVAGGSSTLDDAREGWLTLFGLGDYAPVAASAAASATTPTAATPIATSASEIPLAGNDFGFPNALEGLAVVGDVVYAVHLLDSPEPPNDFQTTVSGGISAVSLSAEAALPDRSLDINDPGFSTPVNFPRALAASPDGSTLYLALAGSDAVMGVDVGQPAAPRLLGFWPTGTNPRGVVVTPDGTTAYVMNYLSRDVSVLALDDLSQREELARVTLTPEPLPAELHRGKVLFNKANDPRLSRNGWLSCASCHLDGGGDGTTWPREEGSRQTMPLWSLDGTAPFHSAATRDEVQDFELDIERFMAGVGLAPGPAGDLLGPPSAGGSADLDALAAFVLGGIRTPAAPAVDAARAARGRALFLARGCADCHAGPNWTTSSLPGPAGSLAPNGEIVVKDVLHDVGTFAPAHDITGEDGFDVPTLLGLAYTAPYFHDGSAATLEKLLAHEAHSGGPLSAGQASDLVAFLRSLDGDSEPFALP